jgi:hypothetical protein
MQFSLDYEPLVGEISSVQRFRAACFSQKGWSLMNVRRAAVPVVCLLASIGASIAQPRVDPLNRYERVLVIVPIIGQGTALDPIRPQYVPVLTESTPLSSTPFIGFTYVMSDDGKFALVEFVARSQSAFQTMLADTTINAFLKGRDTRQAAEAAFQQHKKNFSIINFGVRIP